MDVSAMFVATTISRCPLSTGAKHLAWLSALSIEYRGRTVTGFAALKRSSRRSSSSASSGTNSSSLLSRGRPNACASSSSSSLSRSVSPAPAVLVSSFASSNVDGAGSALFGDPSARCRRRTHVWISSLPVRKTRMPPGGSLRWILHVFFTCGRSGRGAGRASTKVG